MKLLIINALALCFVAAPLVALESLRSRSKWVDENHDEISIVLWLVALIALWLVVVPKLGLAPNPDFFRDQY